MSADHGGGVAPAAPALSHSSTFQPPQAAQRPASGLSLAHSVYIPPPLLPGNARLCSPPHAAGQNYRQQLRRRAVFRAARAAVAGVSALHRSLRDVPAGRDPCSACCSRGCRTGSTVLRSAATFLAKVERLPVLWGCVDVASQGQTTRAPHKTTAASLGQSPPPFPNARSVGRQLRAPLSPVLTFLSLSRSLSLL